MQGSAPRRETRRSVRVVAAGAAGALVAGGLAIGLAGQAQAVRPFVTGVVTNAAGQPLGGVSVTFYDASATGQQSIGSAQTDPDGGYKFFTTTASVKVRYSKFTRQDLYADEWYNDKGTFAAADPVAVPATGVDLGATGLTAGGTISGVVTSDAGAPLDRVAVSAFADDGGSGFDYTDETGAYTITNLPPGSYEVRFSDPDIEEYSSEVYNNATGQAAATPVVVGKDAAVPGVNAGLALAPVTPPASGPDVTGTVVDTTGVPGVGVRVEAYTVGAKQRDAEVVESTYTNRAGAFVLDSLDTAGVTAVKVRFDTYRQEVADFTRFGSWAGGSQGYEGAQVIAYTPGAAPASLTLQPAVAGGVAGKVTNEAGAPAQSAGVTLVDAQGNDLGFASVDPDGTFESRDLAPTDEVYVKFDAEDHVAEWWKDAATKAKAKPVRVRAGALSGGLDASLSAALKALQKPAIDGFPIVGKPLSVDQGEWNQQDGSLFTYQWLVGSTVVGTGQTYTPAKADVGKRLKVRVTNNPGNARVYDPVTVTTKPSQRVGYTSKLKVSVKGQTATFKVKAQKVKEKSVKGRVIVQIKDGDTVKQKVLGKAKIKGATGRMSLAKLFKRLDPGKNKVVFTFQAKTKKVGSDDATKQIKKRR